LVERGAAWEVVERGAAWEGAAEYRDRNRSFPDNCFP
jgi:hypothetical protein